eukprot:3954517-Amphidinium_carterae.2
MGHRHGIAGVTLQWYVCSSCRVGQESTAGAMEAALQSVLRTQLADYAELGTPRSWEKGINHEINQATERGNRDIGLH